MEDITSEELKQRIENGEALNIIDVREEWEHDEFNIGGKLIPLATVPGHIESLSNLKEEEVIVYCRSGNRSGKAKQVFVSNGFTKVRNLLGGMLEWQSKYK